MKAYELIKETYLRKSLFRIIHVLWLFIYASLFLAPWPPELWNWGQFLFGWSGCVLPILLSAGIFGDDIATGRISVLVTKPVKITELYIYRILGLSLQGTLSLLLSAGIIFILHSATNRGSIDHLGLWLLAAWLLFNNFAILSTSISVVLRRANNSVALFVGIIFVYILFVSMMSFARENPVVVMVMDILKYTFPPFELLYKFANGRYELVKQISFVFHTVVLTTIYGLVGIIILNKREFRCVRD